MSKIEPKKSHDSSVGSKKEYARGGEFWDRKSSLVMGDVRQRPQLLNFLGDVKNKKVLDGGCGTGYFTRKIVGLGAEVYGCDIEPNMLKTAKDNEKENPLGIEYDLCDIKKTIYDDNYFDVVVSVGVLFHLDQNEWKEYLKESYRIIKPGGSLVISIEHPFLFSKYSPTRVGSKCWAVHTPIAESSYNNSQKFEEKYYKSDGEVYLTTLWHHSLEFTENAIVESGFSLEKLHEIVVEEEDLKSEFWGNDYGYPAFIQFKAKKP